MAKDRIRVGVLGASGYTGADLVRLAARHPDMAMTVLTANSHAGKPMGAVFPHLATLDLPDLVRMEDADWGAVDAVFCGLPHGTTQEITRDIFDRHPHVRVVDLSADFRLRDPATYAEWYGGTHKATALQKEAVYGLTEHNREAVKDARLVACPGCYPTAVLLATLPLLGEGLVQPSDVVIDAKSGLSGAGRSPKEATLLTEAGEGMSPYSVATHRHMPEIEQELSAVSGVPMTVSFTPHLVPMSRGELVTLYLRLAEGRSVEECRAALEARYRDEYFVHLLPNGEAPSTQRVRGSNFCVLNVFADRIPGRVIVIAAIDNLVKGSSGQAVQNFNLMFGLPETRALEQLPLFP